MSCRYFWRAYSWPSVATKVLVYGVVEYGKGLRTHAYAFSLAASSDFEGAPRPGRGEPRGDGGRRSLPGHPRVLASGAPAMAQALMRLGQAAEHHDVARHRHRWQGWEPGCDGHFDSLQTHNNNRRHCHGNQGIPCRLIYDQPFQPRHLSSIPNNVPSSIYRSCLSFARRHRRHV